MAPSVESGRAPSPRTQTEFNSNLFKAKSSNLLVWMCVCVGRSMMCRMVKIRGRSCRYIIGQSIVGMGPEDG